MKKRHIVVIGILFIFLAAGAVFSALQVQKISNMKKEISQIKKQVKQLKTSVAENEANNQSLEEELQKVAVKSEELDKKEEEKEQKEEQKEQEEKQKEEKEAEAKKKNKKIAIDPGHQGYNVNMSAQEPLGPGSGQMKAKATSGTQGRFTNVPEYELNLNISKQLRTELEKRGYEVLLTREDNDTAISNKERALLAAEYGADIYVRIHANGSDNAGVSGAMTMVPSAQNPFVANLHDKSYALGEAVINAYCQSCGIKNNGVQAFDNMTGINWSSVPVIILEMGFMTNQSDDENMQKPDFQVLMVQGIANGIDQYFEAGN